VEAIVKILTQFFGKFKILFGFLIDNCFCETIIVLLLLLIWFKRKTICGFIFKLFALKILRKHLPDYTKYAIEHSIKYYIWPECQSIDPIESDKTRHTFAVRNDIRVILDKILNQDSYYKCLVVLADTGMGKTSFLINYYAHYIQRFRKPYQIKLIPFGIPDFNDRLKAVDTPEKTILLLDGFDEDSEAIQSRGTRLSDIVFKTRRFYQVIITCHTQFFPFNGEMSKDANVIKVGSQITEEDGSQVVYYKCYLSRFSHIQIDRYLKKRFPFWKKEDREKAEAVIKKTPFIASSPILLNYIDELFDSEKTYINSYQIFSDLIDCWLERESKYIKNKKALSEFLNILAVKIFSDRIEHGCEKISSEDIESVAKEVDIKIDEWSLTNRSFLTKGTDGNYQFIHRITLEFLFATQILKHQTDAINVPLNLWTEQIKNFLYQGFRSFAKYDKKPSGLVNCFIRYSGGTYQISETGKIVTLKPFDISIYPITNVEYEEFDPEHRLKRNDYSNQDDQPVVHVSWEDANKYCQWLSGKTGAVYRLPTEGEWEYASSGNGLRRYPWGDEEPTTEHANYRESQIGRSTPVGSYSLGMTPEGMFDMSGNVWEWCTDWYDEKMDGRVLRGGSFNYSRLLLVLYESFNHSIT
jgi:hypothetical protein